MPDTLKIWTVVAVKPLPIQLSAATAPEPPDDAPVSLQIPFSVST